MSVKGEIDWKLYIICQKKSSEDLRCPTHNSTEVYTAFFNNVEAFSKLDRLPVDIDFCDQGTVDHFVVNQACWHKKCHQKFNTSMLKRVQLKRSKESEELEASSCNSKLKRRCNSVQQNVCLFCDSSSGNLHEFTTLSADKSIKSMASEMNDTDMLVKLADGDLVAIEAKYYLSCLTKS